MSNCAVCHKPVTSGVVVHSECMELLQKTQQLDNKPLTIEELREMAGEPVWVESPGVREYGHYGIVAGVDVESMSLYLESDFSCRDYGTTWLAYRRKPNDWISVEKRLPDEELKQFRIKYPKEEVVEVIVVITGASESTTLYWNGHCFEDLSGEPYSVSHWMPLPAPPEVE